MMIADRTKRVKEARDEAKKEIEAYRKQKDEEFKKFEAEVRNTFGHIRANCLCAKDYRIIRITVNMLMTSTAHKRKQEG